jgi:hypothetical protein
MKQFLTRLLCFFAFLPISLAHTPAYVLQGVSVNLQPDGTAQIPASCLVENACDFEEILIILSGDGTPPSSDNTALEVGCEALGTIIVEVWAKDFLQQWTFSPTYIIVEDNYGVCPNGVTTVQRPYAIARNGLALSFNEEGEAPVHINDFVAAYVVPAGTNEPVFAFSEDPADTLRVINCDDPQTLLFDIYAIDGAPAPSFVSTYAIGTPCNPDMCCAGSFSVINGLSFNMPPEQQIPLRAKDFVVAQENPMAFAFSPDPADSIRIINCEDIENTVLLIAIHGISEDGHFNVADTYAIIEDLQEYCSGIYNGPDNGNACMAYDITSQFGACEIYGHNIAAGTQAFEPSPPSGDCNAYNGWCTAPQNTVWYYFEAPPSGSINIYTSLLSTQIALWEADNCTQLTDGSAILVSAESQADGAPAKLEGLSCLIPGQRYYVQIDAQNGQTGHFSLIIEEAFIDCLAGGEAISCIEATTTAPVNNILAWQHFYNANNQIIGSIANRINPLGEINFEYQTHQGPIRTDDEGSPYLDRNWAISVSNQPVTTVRLRLYFTTAEFEALQMADPNINTADALFLTRVPDGNCGPFETDGELHAPLSSGLAGPSTYYIDFEIPAFSAFYLNGAGGLINNTDELHPDNSIVVFPNPSSGMLTIQKGSSSLFPGPANISLMSLTGQELISGQFEDTTRLNLSGLAPGTYLLRINDGRHAYIERIVIH